MELRRTSSVDTLLGTVMANIPQSYLFIGAEIGVLINQFQRNALDAIDAMSGDTFCLNLSKSGRMI